MNWRQRVLIGMLVASLLLVILVAPLLAVASGDMPVPPHTSGNWYVTNASVETYSNNGCDVTGSLSNGFGAPDGVKTEVYAYASHPYSSCYVYLEFAAPVLLSSYSCYGGERLITEAWTSVDLYDSTSGVWRNVYQQAQFQQFCDGSNKTTPYAGHYFSRVAIFIGSYDGFGGAILKTQRVAWDAFRFTGDQTTATPTATPTATSTHTHTHAVCDTHPCP